MQCGRMLVHRRCRLGAAVADGTIEIQCGYGVLAQRAFEGCAAIHRFGCVISHIPIIVLSAVITSGHWVRNHWLHKHWLHKPGAARTALAILPFCESLKRGCALEASDALSLLRWGNLRSAAYSADKFFSASRAWPHVLSAPPRLHPSRRRRCSPASG
jgi:hypothetical protein